MLRQSDDESAGTDHEQERAGQDTFPRLFCLSFSLPVSVSFSLSLSLSLSLYLSIYLSISVLRQSDDESAGTCHEQELPGQDTLPCLFCLSFSPPAVSLSIYLCLAK